MLKDVMSLANSSASPPRRPTRDATRSATTKIRMVHSVSAPHSCLQRLHRWLLTIILQSWKNDGSLGLPHVYALFLAIQNGYRGSSTLLWQTIFILSADQCIFLILNVMHSSASRAAKWEGVFHKKMLHDCAKTFVWFYGAMTLYFCAFKQMQNSHTLHSHTLCTICISMPNGCMHNLRQPTRGGDPRVATTQPTDRCWTRRGSSSSIASGELSISCGRQRPQQLHRSMRYTPQGFRQRGWVPPAGGCWLSGGWRKLNHIVSSIFCLLYELS